MMVEREGSRAAKSARVAMPSRNTTNTILSLKTGAFSAAVVNADESLLGEKEGLRTLAFVGDLFPYPFQGFVATDKMIAESPNDIKRWLRPMARALMFIRDRPEEAADIAMKKIPMGNMSRPLVIEGIRRFAKSLPDGVPGLPSAQGIKNLMEYDVKAPLKIKEDIPPEESDEFTIDARGEGRIGKQTLTRKNYRKDAVMINARLFATLVLAVFGRRNAYAYKASVLIDFDPKSADQTVVVESIAVDHKDMLYACDRVSGNVWGIDPKNPKLVSWPRPEREDRRKKVRANVSGIVFNAAGKL